MSKVFARNNGRTRKRCCQYRLTSAPLMICLALLPLLLLQACSGSSDGKRLALGAPSLSPLPEDQTPQGIRLDWPPQEDGSAAFSRSTSDDIYPLDGSLYDSHGGSVTASGSSALLVSGTAEPWAHYSLGGFNEETFFAKLEVTFNADTDDSPGGGMWFALANYAAGRWELYKPEAPLFSLEPLVAQDYVSPAGVVHVVAVLNGMGQGVVSQLDFTRTGAGALPEAPEIIDGSSTFYSCTIEWTEVAGAVGYIIYRTTNPEVIPPQRINTSPVTVPYYTDLGVSSSSDYFYTVAAVRQVIGKQSEIFMLSTLEEMLGIPQNLTAVAEVGSATLNWSPVAGASGYNIYRSSKTNLSNEFKINSTPVKGTSFIDIDPQLGIINFYRVTATRVGESEKSNVASCFIPASDLPAPQNLRLVNAIGDSATVAWDWEGTDPAKFRVMVKATDEFQIEPPYVHLAIPEGNVRQDQFDGLDSAELYYVAVCAMNNLNQPGQLSNIIEIETDSYWTLNEPEVIGTGQPQLEVLTEEGDLSAVYFNDKDVMFARRAGPGNWTTEAVLEDDYTAWLSVVRVPVPEGPYMVAAVKLAALDLHAVVGRPGGPWTFELIDGDGTEGDLFSPENGFCMKLAADEDTFAVTHLEVIYLMTGPPFPETNKILYQERPVSGGPWSRDYIWSDKIRQPMYASLVIHEGTSYILRRDLDSNGFFFGSSDDSFASWTNITAVLGEISGIDNDMQRYGDGWATPSCNSTIPALELYKEDSGTWTREIVDDQSETIERSKMASIGNDIMIVARSQGLATWLQYFWDDALGEWHRQPVFVPTGNVPQRMDITTLDDSFYVVYDVSSLQEIHCARMLPPAP